MIGVDPPSLNEFQDSSLKSRFHLDGPDDGVSEPKTPAQAHWWVQPLWVKIVTFVVAVPSFLYLRFATQADPFETLLGKISVGGFVAVCLLQMIFVFRGYWRMDI